MGADLITAVMLKRSDTELKYDRAHDVVARMKVADFDPYMTDLLGIEDIEEGGEEEWLRDTAHAAFDEVARVIEGGARFLNVYENLLGSGLDLFIVGDRTWGDTPDGYDAFVYAGSCREAAQAAGFIVDLDGLLEHADLYLSL